METTGEAKGGEKEEPSLLSHGQCFFLVVLQMQSELNTHMTPLFRAEKLIEELQQTNKSLIDQIANLKASLDNTQKVRWRALLVLFLGGDTLSVCHYFCFVLNSFYFFFCWLVCHLLLFLSFFKQFSQHRMDTKEIWEKNHKLDSEVTILKQELSLLENENKRLAAEGMNDMFFFLVVISLSYKEFIPFWAVTLQNFILSLRSPRPPFPLLLLLMWSCFFSGGLQQRAEATWCNCVRQSEERRQQ